MHELQKSEMHENWHTITEFDNSVINDNNIVDDILSPVTTNSNLNIEKNNAEKDNTEKNNTDSHDFQVPKVFCNAKAKKFKLFDKFSYVQLVEHIIRMKFQRDTSICKRGKISEILEGLIDLEDERNVAFIDENQKKLLKLRNKRQLIMFLNKKFKNVHRFETLDDRNKFAYDFVKSFIYWVFIILVILLVFIIALLYIFFNSELIENNILKDSKHLPVVKTLKIFILAIMDSN